MTFALVLMTPIIANRLPNPAIEKESRFIVCHIYELANSSLKASLWMEKKVVCAHLQLPST